MQSELGFLTVRCLWRHGERWRGGQGLTAILGWREDPAIDLVEVLGVCSDRRLKERRGSQVEAELGNYSTGAGESAAPASGATGRT